MQLHIGCAAIALMVALGGVAAGAETPASTSAPSSDRMDQVERRLDRIEQEYQTNLKQKDQEIERLRGQIGWQPTTQPTAAPATSSASDEIERTRREMLEEIQSKQSPPPTQRVPANFNPDIAVIGNFIGNVSTDNDNPARNRLGLGELEIEMREAVDPRADAVVALPFSREVENPLFFDPAHADGGISTGVDIEEAYLLMHDFGVPDLTAKLGRFHLRYGRQNLLHSHDWPTVDNNFVNQSFLAGESIVGDGLSLSYIIPPRLVGNQYFELDAEIISGEGSDEQPVINNDALVDSPALNLHALWNHDVAPDWNLEVGGSWLTGKRNDDNRQNANLYGADVTLIHTDPTGGFFNQLIQCEAIYGDVDTSRMETQHAYGAYLLLQQQLNRDWYAGVRLDWTQNALDEHQEVWGVSPYLSWYWSEFLRFRVEYQHKAGDTPTEDTVYVQATWVFGAHPPHPYWSMK